MPDKIKCSYKDCFRHFNTPEAMKKHKAKDRAHDYYCKKCDLDCNDDMELLYHQITSQRHVACPVCGREFVSEAGRDRHVEIDHVPQQKLRCMGCDIEFGRAASLMAHIERNECEVIRSEDFHRQKAEKQIEQDAWAAALDPMAGATILSNARQYPPVDDELNLLDDDRAFVNTDWQGRPQHDEENEHNGPYVGPRSEQMSNLSISRFPPLSTQNRPPPSSPPLLIDDGNDQTNQHLKTQHSNTQAGAWASGTNHASRLFTTTHNPKPSKPRESNTSINLLDTFDDDDIPLDHNTPAPNKTQSHISLSTNRAATSIAAQPSTLPPTSRAESQDPNAPHAHLKTHTPFRPPSTRALPVSQFFDPVMNVYICPSTTCGAHLPTPQAFDAHLLKPPHVGELVQCPACYKQFKTTTSLIAHVESGSRRCRVRDALDLDLVIQRATGGLMGVEGVTEEGGVRYVSRGAREW